MTSCSALQSTKDPHVCNLRPGVHPGVRDLTQFFCPRSIAVVGASRKEGSVGHALVRNLIYGGYTGVIYPVNPNAKGIQGIPCFPDLNSIARSAGPGGGRGSGSVCGACAAAMRPSWDRGTCW